MCVAGAAGIELWVGSGWCLALLGPGCGLHPMEVTGACMQ